MKDEERVKKAIAALKPAAVSVRNALRRIVGILRRFSPVDRLRLERAITLGNIRLNVGCGKVRYEGWLNVDIEPPADVVMDIVRKLPFGGGTLECVYSEHVIEHFSCEKGEKMLKEFSRCLKKGGRIRIATPDLDYIVGKYSSGWKDQDWLSRPEYSFIDTRGKMLNVGFRWWGHKYLYNEEDLRRQLECAGFTGVSRAAWGESAHPYFRGLETRKDSTLVMEGEKA